MKKQFIIICLVLLTLPSNAQVDTVCVGTIHTYGVNGSLGSTYTWNVNGCTILSNPATNNSIDVHWDAVGIHPISVTETNINHCSKTILDSVLVLPLPYVNFETDTTICCSTQPFTLIATNPNATYLWQDGSTASSFPVTTAGTYWVQVSLGNSCSIIDSIHVDCAIVPSDNFFLHDTTLCEGLPLDVTIPNYYNSIRWSDGDILSYTKRFELPGYYYVELKSQCLSLFKDFNLFYKDCNCYLYYPNAFTPNEDNINECFAAKYECDFDYYHFYIYNRWGELIFHTNDPSACWDGTYKNRVVPQGVYVWIVDYSGTITHGMQTRKGTVTVVK